ncbi:MAG: N-acetylmuramoyl-L-alanine amidase [Rikenellaceae bacterium]
MSLLLCSQVAFAQQKHVVVLDAGHGGKDPGAVAAKAREKDINLAIVKAAGAILEKNSGIEVVYTRKDDTFVELSGRSDIANKCEADLFVSVHTNSSSSVSASGTETFVMGVDKNNANLGVAMRENGVISLESDFKQKYEGYDPTSAESHIMFTLMQYGHQQQSLTVAQQVQSNFTTAKRKNRGVKQAGFLVLWRNAMPSVLIEVGFITNAQEREYLTSTKGAKEMGEAIASAVISFLGSKAGAPAHYEGAEDECDDEPIYGGRGTSSKVIFAIQIKSSKKRLELTSENFGALVMLVEERRVEDVYKYSVGELYMYSDAQILLKKIKNRVKDAFIVAYDNNGKPLAVSKAKELTEKN